jgi:hypothetical protein
MKNLLNLTLSFLFTLLFNFAEANTTQSNLVNDISRDENSVETTSIPPVNILNFFNSVFNFNSIKNSLVFYLKNRAYALQRREINKSKTFLRERARSPFVNIKNRNREKRKAKEQEKINDMPPIYR